MNSLVGWRPFMPLVSQHQSIEIQQAQGCHLIDTNNKSYIDAISSWWVITHGHCHPHIVNAIKEHAGRFDQIIYSNFTHKPAQDLLTELKKFLPKDLCAAFFSNSGSDAIEVAIKMALQYLKICGDKRRKFMSLKGSYHGDTVGAMSVSQSSYFTNAYNELLFKVTAFDKAIKELDDDVAVLIIEPLIQGAGGMVIWPPNILIPLLKKAREKNVVVIFDEIMTGFYRTKTMFAFEQLNYTPDILCLSKGLTAGFLPLALTIANKTIYQAFLSEDKQKMFFHGHSFSANPLACVAAVANLQLCTSHVSKKVARIESINCRRLKKISGANIESKRYLGAIAAFAIKDKGGYFAKCAPIIQQYALKKGVFIRPLGNVVYILPPYCISESQLHYVWDTIEEALGLL